MLPAVADAGFRAVAVDLRGYGASDKPPRGYDGYTMAADVAGLIRALGERTATIVGSGFGGMVGWTAAAFHPKLVRRLVVLGAAHPLRLRAAIFADPRGQFSAGVADLAVPAPALRARARPRRGGAGGRVPAPMGRTVLGGRCRPSTTTRRGAGRRCGSRRRRSARWRATGGRSARCCGLHGYRFVRQLQKPLVTPTLQLHGALDPAVLPRTAQGSSRYVIAPYEWRLLDGVGHFPHLEEPDLVLGEILRWAKS